MPDKNQFTRIDQLNVRPIPMLIANLVPENALVGLIGASGTCKSFLALGWGFHVATGLPWFGRRVKQGAVFYLAGEGNAGISKRVAALEKATRISRTGQPFFVSSGIDCLCEQANVDKVIADADERAQREFFASGVEPKLFVIDTLARAMGGRNENSSEDMGALVDGVGWLRDQWNATVLIVHHSGLDPSSQDRGRGSSALRAALDAEMVIKPAGGELVLKTTKAKDWAPAADLFLAKHEVEMFVPVSAEDAVPGGPTEARETSLVLIDPPGVQRQADLKSRVLELHAQGQTVRAIAAHTGVPHSSVGRWIKESKRADAVPSHGVLHTPMGGTPGVPWDKTRGTDRDKWDTQRGEP